MGCRCSVAAALRFEVCHPCHGCVSSARLQRPLRHPFCLAPDSTFAPPGSAAGNPAVFLRKLKPEETAFLGESAEHYARLAAEHAQVGGPAAGSQLAGHAGKVLASVKTVHAGPAMLLARMLVSSFSSLPRTPCLAWRRRRPSRWSRLRLRRAWLRDDPLLEHHPSLPCPQLLSTTHCGGAAVAAP